MTDRSTAELGEFPRPPSVALTGPASMAADGSNGSAYGSTAAPVDGVAVIFFDPTTLSPFVVFVNDGLADLLGRGVDELLGESPAELFSPEDAETQLQAMQRALIGEPLAESEITVEPDPEALASVTIDLAAEDRDRDRDRDRPGDQPLDNRQAVTDAVTSRQHQATQTLLGVDGSSVLVQATYTTLPSMTLSAPYVVAQYRDLSRGSAERLLADQSAVTGSLSRGHELGQLCHQICNQIEEELGDGSSCWLGIVNPAGRLEPVVTGDTSFEVAAEVMELIEQSSSTPTKRVVSIEGLPADTARPLRNRLVKSLWYIPLIATSGSETMGSKPNGALVIATPRQTPDEEITRSLDHLASVTASAIDHYTAAADIAHQSLHDPLTQLPNRALIVDRLGQALARLERDGIALSVLLVDIDHFKNVNDTRGPEIGDRVLLEVAGRLLAAVRLGDTVGRISSDQYLVMCVATNGELDASAVARRILRSLSEPIQLSPTPRRDTSGEGNDQRVTERDELRITASVGVVVVDEPGLSPATLIGNAESALSRATAEGRGQFAMFEDNLRQHVLDRHETEQALHRAIVNNELVMHYQPLVEIRTGYMVGAEALVRWARPGHDLIYPGSFIPIAEESELIIPMGNWIIDRVCEDLGHWSKSHGRSPMVTVNLAARQLAVDTLVPTVVSALQRNDLHPRHLGFEITESMEISDLESASTNLTRLSELGCRIAIDDFGIGHATLDYLRRFSMADALKIDRSFVAGLNNCREDTAIVNASIALASSLGLQVIAEGVENIDQLLALGELGCRYAQGFALAKPMPLDEVLPIWEKAKLYDSNF